MRLIGLTLCLLASSFGARAECGEDRVAALEARVKELEAALQSDSGKPAALAAANADCKSGTYEIAGGQVIHSADSRSGTPNIEVPRPD
jgi:hypothetical protein